MRIFLKALQWLLQKILNAKYAKAWTDLTPPNTNQIPTDSQVKSSWKMESTGY